MRSARVKTAWVWTGVLVLLIAGTFTLVQRHSGPSVSYVVHFDLDEPDAPRVLATFNSFQHTDPLVLEAYLQHGATGFEIDSVFGAGSSPVAYQHETITRSENGHAYIFDRVRVEHPLRSGTHIDYRLQLGKTEGDVHTLGLAGTRYGRATRGWVVTSLAQLLMVPAHPELMRKATVRYELPDRWSVTGAFGGTSLPHRLGGGSFADLFFAPLAIGRMSTYYFDDLKLRVAVADEGGAATVALADRVHDIYRGVAQAFQFVPQDPFFVVLTPPDTDGFTVYVEPTYFGYAASYQGGNLLSVDDLASHIAQRVAHAAHADSAFAADRWFVPSLLAFAGARVSRASATRPPNPLDSTALDDYVQMIFESGDVALSPSPSPTLDTLHAIKGRAVIETLDAFLRERSEGRDSLEAIIPRLSGVSSSAALDVFLETNFHCELDSFFVRYVHGTAPLPYPSIPVAENGGVSVAARHAVRDSVALVITYDGHAYLETCGCKVNMWGGVARLATWAKAFRRDFRGPVFMLSAGNTFPMDKTNVVLDSLAVGELQVYLSLLGSIGFHAAVVGQSELFQGASMLERMARDEPITFVAANIRRDEIPGVVQYRLERDANCTLGVTGLVTREGHPLYERIWETRTADIGFEPAVPSAARAVDAMRGEGADLVVVAGKIKPAAVRTIARVISTPSVIISYQPVCKCVNTDGRLYLNDRSGFLGETLVLYPRAGRYGVSTYVLYRDKAGRVVDFREQQVYMTEQIADDPAARHAIDDFYMSKPAALSPTSLAMRGFWRDEIDRGARFAGVSTCRACHDKQYSQWITTSHGSAFKTLLKQHRQYNPDCVSCHVTGFEQKTGYAFGDMQSPMINVQCEACHGPGAAHVAAAGNSPMLRQPTDHLCKTCHEREHSDMTDQNFPEYYARTVH